MKKMTIILCFITIKKRAAIKNINHRPLKAKYLWANALYYDNFNIIFKICKAIFIVKLIVENIL